MSGPWQTCSPRSPSRTGATSWTRCSTAKRQSARSSPTSRWRNLRSRSTCACSARWRSSGQRQMDCRGTGLDCEPPTRVVQTWLFEGCPAAEAVERVDFHATDGVTTMTWKLAFRDQAGRDHMTRYDGIEASWDNVEAYLRTLRAA